MIEYEIHPNHANQSVSPYKCSVCGGQGQWRRGYEFEHEKICYKCDFYVWCPGYIEDEVGRI